MRVSMSHDFGVRVAEQTDLGGVSGCMARAVQQLSNSWSQALVDEELHAEARNGNSRSRIASAAN